MVRLAEMTYPAVDVRRQASRSRYLHWGTWRIAFSTTTRAWNASMGVHWIFWCWFARRQSTP